MNSMKRQRNWTLLRNLAVALLVVVAVNLLGARVLLAPEGVAICETNASSSPASYAAQGTYTSEWAYESPRCFGLVSQEPIIAEKELHFVRDRQYSGGEIIRLGGGIAIEFQQQNFMITRINVSPFAYEKAGRLVGFGFYVDGNLQPFLGKIVPPTFQVIVCDAKRRQIGSGSILTKRDQKTRLTCFDGFVVSTQAESIDEIVLLSVVDN